MTEQPRVTISIGGGSLITLLAKVKSILLTRYNGEEVVVAGHEISRVLINLDLGSLLAEDNNEQQRTEQDELEDHADEHGQGGE